MDKHPAFWKIRALAASKGEAQARATMAAHLAQLADAALGAALKDAGFDPKGDYLLDDVAETITVNAPAKAP